jgi:hypothetical protein
LRSAQDTGQFLSARLGAAASVSFSRARTAPVRATRGVDGAWHLRLHRFFDQAPDGILEDLASWLRAGLRSRRACERLDAWIDRSLAQLPPRSKRAVFLDPDGTVHDLTPMTDVLLAGPFAEDFRKGPPPAVTWGRRGRSKARHTLRMGTYLHTDHLVRVHPVLDQTWVPAWFVSFVLHHEVLHAALDQERSAERRGVHHGPAFRDREKAHPDFARATAWENENLERLIRSARSGTAKAAPVQSRPPTHKRPALRRFTQALLFPFR